MRRKGKIATWHDDKGYGFVSPLDGGKRTFVHISAFANEPRRPVVGDAIQFSMSTDARGRPCAENATFASASAGFVSKWSADLRMFGLASGFLLIVCGAALASAIPALVLPLYLVVSAATFFAYAIDKRAAQKGHWRTSESTLHLLALAGGWPGALLAQKTFRHKTRKRSFQVIFWATVTLNCAILLWLFTPEGAETWRSIVPVVM